METTRQQKQARAIRMHEMAQQLVQEVGTQIKAEGILQAPEIVAVFAAACAMSIVQGHYANPALGSELAGTALRSIIKNLIVQGVKIPDLEMDGWVPPNIQRGNDSQH